MSVNWRCPQCGSTNSKPEHLLRLERLTQKLGAISLGGTSLPKPRCSGCGYEADANEILKGTLDSAPADIPEHVSPTQPPGPRLQYLANLLRGGRLRWIVLGGVFIGVLCLGAVIARGGYRYVNRDTNIEVPTATAIRRISPSATPQVSASATAAQGSLVRTNSPAEAQKLMQEKAPAYLAQVAIEEYSVEQRSQMSTVPYTVMWSESQPLAWGTAWCTTTEAILHENLDHILYTFILDGKTIPLDRFVEAEYYDGDMQGYCHEYYTVLTDWKPGIVLIETVIAFDQTINDGWDDFAPSTRTYEYTVIVSR